MTDNPLKNREIIFEIMTIGAYAKVTAVDVATMTEGSIQGPRNTPESILRQNAVKKLEYVMRKNGFIS